MKRTGTRKAAPRIKASRTLKARAPIMVPKAPAAAFDDTRPPSTLLVAQLEHLQWAALPASMRAPGILPRQQVKTEGEAAQKIGELTTAILAANAPKRRTRAAAKKSTGRAPRRPARRVSPAKRKK